MDTLALNALSRLAILGEGGKTEFDWGCTTPNSSLKAAERPRLGAPRCPVRAQFFQMTVVPVNLDAPLRDTFVVNGW